MQLDAARIAIRERDYLDLLDMALRVIRASAGPLLIVWAVGALPIIALNTWLVAAWTQSGAELSDASEYVYPILALMICEIPWVTAPMTLYLGQMTFADRPRMRRLIRDCFASWGQMAWYQGVLRVLLAPLFFTWFFLFAARPYMNEVILLERNPFSAGRSNRITTGRRSSALHAGMWGELFGRWLISIVVGALLLGSVYGSLAVAAGMLFAVWNASPLTHFVALQLAWWLVMGYFTVVRFLSYLDLRIRREGWEVELLMRAEESRLKRHWT